PSVPRQPSAPVMTPSYAAQPSKAEAGAHQIDVQAYACIRDLAALDSFIAKAYARGLVAFDTETDALSSANANLCGVSLAVAHGEACYIPVGHEHEGEGGLFAESDKAPLQQIACADVIARLKPLLEGPAVLKVAQNAKYDMGVLSRYGIDVGPIDDTMLISYVLEGGLHGHGMDELSQLWLGHTPIAFKTVAGTGKTQKSFKHVPLDQATCYAAEDADVTLRLYDILRPRLVREGLLNVYETLERPLPAVLAEMEGHGVRIAPDRLRRLSQEFAMRMADYEAKAQELVGRPFNLGSPKQ